MDAEIDVKHVGAIGDQNNADDADDGRQNAALEEAERQSAKQIKKRQNERILYVEIKHIPFHLKTSRSSVSIIAELKGNKSRQARKSRKR